MMFAEGGIGNTGPSGGYVRAAARENNSTYQPLFSDLIASLNVNSDKASGGQSALTMAEAYYYFAGGTPYSGNQKVKTDYTGNVFGTPASKAIYALPSCREWHLAS